MYESIFINCNGSNIFTTLGALDKLKEILENVKIWNVCGSASLILYFKLFGLTSKQTYENLKKLEIVNTFINGHSLFPEDEKEKKEYLRNYLEKFFKTSLFNEEVNLQEAQKITGLTPCFIVWNRSQQKIVNLNPKDTPSVKLLDCVLASLTNIGVFSTHQIKNQTYSSLENIECFPVSYSYYLKLEKLFYLANITTFVKEYSLGINLGPLSQVEDEFLLQKGEYNKHRIEKSYQALPHSENFCKLYSVYSRGNSKEEEKASLFILGHLQANGFLESKDTEKIYKDYLESIFSQS
jgi:hypothetical protein